MSAFALDPALDQDLEAGLADLVARYEDFHRDPELSMQEHRTADRITGRLQELGLDPLRVGGTGVVATIENGAGPVVAYRADIDGLPITEATGLDYSSTAEGTLPDGTRTDVMHGCGHDSHISVGLELARLLQGHRDLWSGTVVLLFQPGEETAAGAAAMIADDLWEKVPRPRIVYGQHLWPIRAGQVQLSAGTAMAMADSLEVTVHGRQAHGSQPERSIDPVVLGSYIVTRLQSVVSREIAGSDMAVVTVGSFHAGTKENIIPARAVLALNVRTFDPAVRERVLAAIERMVRAEALASGAPEPGITVLSRFPRLVNDPEAAHAALARFQDVLGEDQATLVDPVTGSEDVGAFGDSLGVPTVYWFFGGFHDRTLTRGAVAGNHSPHFAPDDVPTALRTGVRAALAAVLGDLAA